MAILDISALKRVATLKREVIEVPEWDGEVILRELTGAERNLVMIDMADMFGRLDETGSFVPRNADDLRLAMRVMAAVVALSWIKEDGCQVITTPEAEADLRSIDFGILSRLATETMRLSGMAKGAEDDAKKN